MVELYQKSQRRLIDLWGRDSSRKAADEVSVLGFGKKCGYVNGKGDEASLKVVLSPFPEFS
jgi:hypothetical protein